MSDTRFSRRVCPAQNTWRSTRFRGRPVRRLNIQRPGCRFRLPRFLVTALILAVVGLSGGCSLFSSPKKQSTLPYNPWIKPAKADSQPNWFESLFAAKKEKPKGVAQWINQERPGS
jgi:hypothetical protein